MFEKWIGNYRVRISEWVDNKYLHCNLQYFAPGSSLSQPPMQEKTVFITNDSAGRRVAYEFTDSLVGGLWNMAIPTTASKVVLTFGKEEDS